MMLGATGSKLVCHGRLGLQLGRIRGQRRVVIAAQSRLSAIQELQIEKEMDRFPEVTKLEFKKPLKIAEYPNPCLRAVNGKISPTMAGIQDLAKEMFRVMYSDDGVGLAAPQVGVNIRMMVFNPSDTGDPAEQLALLNPSIIKFGKKKEIITEGCLSFRNVKGPRDLIFGDVERPIECLVNAWDLSGKQLLLQLTGFQSRIFQHEYDHLQGVLFFERMTPESLEKAKPELIALEEKFMKENPGVEIQRIRQ